MRGMRAGAGRRWLCWSRRAKSWWLSRLGHCSGDGEKWWDCLYFESGTKDLVGSKQASLPVPGRFGLGGGGV